MVDRKRTHSLTGSHCRSGRIRAPYRHGNPFRSWQMGFLLLSIGIRRQLGSFKWGELTLRSYRVARDGLEGKLGQLELRARGFGCGR